MSSSPALMLDLATLAHAVSCFFGKICPSDACCGRAIGCQSACHTWRSEWLREMVHQILAGNDRETQTMKSRTNRVKKCWRQTPKCQERGRQGERDRERERKKRKQRMRYVSVPILHTYTHVYVSRCVYKWKKDIYIYIYMIFIRLICSCD